MAWKLEYPATDTKGRHPVDQLSDMTEYLWV